MSGDARALPDCRLKTLVTPNYIALQVRSSDWVELELVGLPVKALTLDARRSFQFIVHAAGWLHSMDAVVDIMPLDGDFLELR